MLTEHVIYDTTTPEVNKCDSDGVSLIRTPKMKTAYFGAIGDGTLTPTAGTKIRVIGYQYSVLGNSGVVQTLNVYFTTSTTKILYVIFNNIATGIGYGDSLSGLNIEGAVNETITIDITGAFYSLVIYYEEL